MYQDTLLCIFACISPEPRSFKNILMPSPRPDHAAAVLACMYDRCTMSLKAGSIHFFPLPSSSHRPRWLSPKDALSLPQGVVILHSPLWWTMQLDWGSPLLCVDCESVCVCCHCTVCWNNSWIQVSLRMKRTNLSRFTSRSSSGPSAFVVAIVIAVIMGFQCFQR